MMIGEFEFVSIFHGDTVNHSGTMQQELENN